jgi:UDP-N-acetylglucosamine enolpyruvyl transferase
VIAPQEVFEKRHDARIHVLKEMARMESTLAVFGFAALLSGRLSARSSQRQALAGR